MAARAGAIPWNPALLVSIAFYWVYAYYAAITAANVIERQLITLVLSACFVGLNAMARKTSARRQVLSITTGDVGVYAVCLGFAVIAGWRELHESLANDQLYHVLKAFTHAMHLLDRDILQPHSAAALALDKVSYKTLLYPVNLACLTAASLLFYWCYSLRRAWIRLPVSFVVFALLRTWIGTYVVASDIHPLLRLLPLNVFSVLFGITPFAFRLPALVVLALLQVGLFRRGRALFGTWTTLLAVLALGTAPLIWHVSSIPEASIWSALVFTAVIWLCDTSANRVDDIDFFSVYALIAAASVMRQSAFIVLLPVGCLQIYGWLKSKKLPSLRQLLEQWSPLLLMIPWTIHVVFVGTPATDHGDTPLVDKLDLALSDGRAFTYLYYHLGMIWFALMLIGLIPLKRRNWLANMLFAMCIVLFYSVVPHIWGLPRYQAEIGFAACSIGLATALYLIRQMFYMRYPDAYKYITTVGLFCLIAANTYAYKQIHQVDGPIDETTSRDRTRNGSIRMLSENVYDFDRALQDIAAQGLDHGLYIDGTVYGAVPQILANYSLGAVRSSEELPPIWQGADPRAIEQTPSCQSALFVDWGYEKTRAAVTYLKNHGWQLKGEYTHPRLTGNTLYFLSRFPEKVTP